MIKITASEAIRRIKTHIETHAKRERQAVLITAALNMAVEALENQIPKKIKLIHNSTYGSDFVYICPTCKAKRNTSVQRRFCDFCGQALDWEGAEEEYENEMMKEYIKINRSFGFNIPEGADKTRIKTTTTEVIDDDGNKRELIKFNGFEEIGEKENGGQK